MSSSAQESVVWYVHRCRDERGNIRVQFVTIIINIYWFDSEVSVPSVVI